MSIKTSLPQDSAHLHVNGAARYTDDIPTPANSVHLAFGLAQIAHGTIEAMNLDAVRAAEGVVAVYTAEDLPFANDVSPSPYLEPMLCTGEVHFHGQPLFIVAADTHLQARRAARLAEVSYAEKPAILSIDQAIAAKSQFEEPQVFSKGDADSAIAAAEHTLSGSIEIGGQEHFYLESHVALALPQDDTGIEVHSSTQHPSEIQHKVAESIGVPMHDVRVVCRRMGGGFGGKESQGNAPAVACSIVAKLTNRPASMRYDRDDDMMVTGKRHDFRIAYRVGFDAAGQIAGVEFTQYARCGWAQDLSLSIADRAMFHADNAYFLPHAHIVSHRLRTHTVSNTAFRGFGGPQGVVGIERVIDEIAHYLGKDPLSVRKVNFYAPFAENRGQTTPYHMEVTDCVIGDMVDHLEKTSDYQQRKAEIAEWNDKNPVLKKGIALTPVKFGISFTFTQLNQAGALVHVYQDGTVQINHGGTEMGQGLYVKMAQVAAEEFGLPMSAIRHTATDTSKVPNTSPTAASSGSDMNGMAVKYACEEIKARLRNFLMEKYNCSEADTGFYDGMVWVAKMGAVTKLPFKDVALQAYQARIGLSATGYYATPKVVWDRAAGSGHPFYYFAYGAACSEVVIDTLTGENRILRSDLLLDAGKSLNPAMDIGQLEGGFVQGAGWLTTEELVWDDHGRLRTHAPSTYKIPAVSCRPKVMNSALWHDGENREDTIHRSKAVGEPPLILGISVLLALSDAIGAAGGESYPALNAPATAEQVLRQISR